jgi:hypothetical protein
MNEPYQSYWLSAYDVASIRLNGGDRAIEVTPFPFDLDQSFIGTVASCSLAENRGSRLMPTDIIVVTLTAAAFGIFAATLYWADLHTGGLGK